MYCISLYVGGLQYTTGNISNAKSVDSGGILTSKWLGTQRLALSHLKSRTVPW